MNLLPLATVPEYGYKSRLFSMPNYTMLAWNASREAGAANLIFRLNYAASASLTINCRKTKILSWTRNVNGLVQAGGEQIEAVDKFTYLGSEIGGTDLDIESRIKKARSAFGILSPVWRNANLSTGLKLRVFKSK